MNNPKTRVALVTTQDPLDLSSWSGTQYRVYEQLKKQFDEVDAIGPARLNRVERFVVKVVMRVFPVVFKKYSKIHCLLHGYLRAKHFEKLLRKHDYSFVFASACCPVVAFLKTRLPIVYLSDATFELLVDYYEQFSGLSRLSLFEGEHGEKKAIHNASLSIFSSDWAAQSAVKHYGADRDKVKVCLFGANIDDTVPEAPAEKIARVGKRCDLLFLARDWHRKGGPVALGAFHALKKRGYEVTLTICGCVPDHYEETEGLTVIPFLNKAIESDKAHYTKLMAESHFLILPTVADCTPMVLSEANAYSMPVITSNTGGIPSLVKEGESGYLLPVDATGEDYAEQIINAFYQQPETYLTLTTSSRRRYEQALNWDSWGSCVKNLIVQELAQPVGGECYE